MTLPLMPKATAVWLLENTTLTFQQIADFCGMHVLEIQAIADRHGLIATGGIVISNPRSAIHIGIFRLIIFHLVKHARAEASHQHAATKNHRQQADHMFFHFDFPPQYPN